MFLSGKTEEEMQDNYILDNGETTFVGSFTLPNIGKMIEFLGEDLQVTRRIETVDKKLWGIYDFGGFNKWIEEELCDALWEAVKYKLNQ